MTLVSVIRSLPTHLLAMVYILLHVGTFMTLNCCIIVEGDKQENLSITCKVEDRDFNAGGIIIVYSYLVINALHNSSMAPIQSTKC